MRSKKVRPWLAAILVCALALAVPVGAGAADMGATATWAPWASLRAIAENWPIIVIGTSLEWSTPDIDGKYAVYQERLVDADGTGPGAAAGDWNIYLLNLNSGVRTPVAAGAGDQYGPSISGDWVVYTDDSGASAEVKAYRISTGAPKNVTNRAADQYDPDVSGSRVVYTDAANGIHAFDLSSNADTLVSASGDQPSISGDRVVYRNGTQIVLASLRGGLGVILANDAGGEQLPCISGDYVAYVDNATDNAITVYTISTGGSTTIAPPAGEDSLYPSISGAIVVWRNERAGGQHYLVAHDVLRAKTVTVADPAPDSFTYPQIDGTRFVCVGTPGASGFGDIMLGTLKAPTVSLSSPSTVNYGAKPKLTGTLAENGEVLGRKALDVLKSTNGGFTYTKVGTVTTNDNGAFSYTLPASYAMARYRVRFNGETWGFISTELSHFSAHSVARDAAVYASLGKPAGYPKTGKKSKSYSVYGALKPRQTATASSAGVVVIKCYQRKSGKWKYRKTVKAKVYDYDTYSRYKGSVKLPYAGRWRMRAYFQGSPTNAAKYSSYRYVRVE